MANFRQSQSTGLSGDWLPSWWPFASGQRSAPSAPRVLRPGPPSWVGPRKKPLTFDAQRAAEFAKRKAQPKFQGFCARYVFAAVGAGFGLNEKRIDPRANITATDVLAELKRNFDVPEWTRASGSAREYGDLLTNLGWFKLADIEMKRREETNPATGKKEKHLVPTSAPRFGCGDILIFQERDDQIDHRHGHIQIHDGKQWISDFVQRDPFWPNSNHFSQWQTTAYWDDQGKLGERYYATLYAPRGAPRA